MKFYIYLGKSQIIILTIKNKIKITEYMLQNFKFKY